LNLVFNALEENSAKRCGGSSTDHLLAPKASVSGSLFYL